MKPRSKPDFELFFKADGTVELHNRRGHVVWTSDADDDFLDEFGEEMFDDENDADDILEYLEEKGLVDLEQHEIDIIENDIADESMTDEERDDFIEGDYTDRSH